MSIKVKIQSQYILDSPMNGVSFDTETQAKVDLLQGYVGNMYKYGVKPNTGGGWTNAELVNGATQDFDFDHFNLVMSLEGSEVYDFWPQVKVLTTNMHNSTPIGLINSIKAAVMSEPIKEVDYTGDDYASYVESFESVELEPERQKTWFEWAHIGFNYHTTEVEEYSYFGAHFCVVDKGRALTGTELQVIQSANDAELVIKIPVIETDII